MSESPIDFSDLNLMDPDFDSNLLDFNNDAFEFNSNMSAFNDNGGADNVHLSMPEGLSHLCADAVPGTGHVRSPTPDFSSPVDAVTDEILAEHRDDDPLFDDFVGSVDFVPSPRSNVPLFDELIGTETYTQISPPPSSSYSPNKQPSVPPSIVFPSNSLLPTAQLFQPCSPPPGFPAHLPLRPCSPPPGFPTHMPRPPPGPASIWRPCSPLPMPTQMVYSSPVVARTPWHHPGVSKRLGLQTEKGVSKGKKSAPRSVPGKSVTSKKAVLPRTMAFRPAPLTLATQKADGASSDTKASNPPANRLRRKSIHLEDLYDSDEDNETNTSTLPPPSSSSQPGKRKRSPRTSDVEVKKQKIRKLLAEIQDTEEFTSARSKDTENDDGDDSDDEDFSPQWLPKGRKGSEGGIRRSMRVRKEVDYAEDD